jgi:beta-lactamase class A
LMENNDLWLSENLQNLNRGSSEWAICFTDLQTNKSLKFNADLQMDTMSVVKIAILVCFLTLSFEKEIDPNRRIQIKLANKRLGTGVLALLEEGAEVSLSDAANLMITVSDNTATDLIIESIGGVAVINRWFSTIGIGEIQLSGTSFDWFKALAVFMDKKCESYGPEELFKNGYPINDKQELLLARKQFHFQGKQAFSLASAEAITKLLQLIKLPSLLHSAVRNQALQILGNQIYKSRIPRYLPNSANVYHKTGDFTPFIANDAGIVEIKTGECFAMCMLSKSNQLPWGYSEEIISQMTSLYFQNFTELYSRS